MQGGFSQMRQDIFLRFGKHYKIGFDILSYFCTIKTLWGFMGIALAASRYHRHRKNLLKVV